jgi:hypothetical protein
MRTSVRALFRTSKYLPRWFVLVGSLASLSAAVLATSIGSLDGDAEERILVLLGLQEEWRFVAPPVLKPDLDFSLRDLQGETVRLKDLVGSTPMVIEFVNFT